MSYNTRRSGGNFGANSANSIGNIGQRRPQTQSLSNSFIPGGQLSQGNKQQQQYQQQRPAQQPPQQQQQQFKQQPPSQPQSQAPPPPPVKQQPTPPPTQTLQPTPPPNVSPPVKEEPEKVEEGTNGDESTTGSPIKKRPFWMRRPPGKISKKERLRRRNLRLRKILQPKNALMVLNELAGNVVYNMTEIVGGLEPICRASVLVDGTEHVGVGKSKVMAKQNAAESAIKHLVLSKLRADAANVVKAVKIEENSTNNGTSAEENVASTTTPMETTEEGNTANTETDVSWSHVASYALHKLLTAWDEGDNLTERIAQATASIVPMVPAPVTGPDGVWKPMGGPVEKKPAKKLPENAALMNPVMLLNQMRPNAVYEEVSKTGTPPHVMFTIKCTTDNEAFFGTGSSKKAARKQCAFDACKKVLNIEYPPEFIEAEGLDKTAVSMQIG